MKKDLLLRAVRAHRIFGRFARRVEQECPDWCSSTLLEHLDQQQVSDQAKVLRLIEAAREVVERYPDQQHPPIFFKGFSIYALLNDPQVLRYSNDIDVLAHEPPRFAALLGDLGFTSVKAAAPHEYANLRRDRLTIDIHAYFPVWSAPMVSDGITLHPSVHVGCWVQPADLIHHRLDYDAVYAQSTCGAAFETTNLRVPNAEMAILLLCAHAFKDYAEWWMAKTVVRASTLADIHDLARLPSFDPQRFLNLAERYHVQDAVRYISRILEHFGLTALPAIAPTVSEVRGPNLVPFPKRLWHGFWIDIDWPIADLFVRSMRMDQIVGQMNSTAITLAQEPTIYTVGDESSHTNTFAQIILLRPGDYDIPFSCSVRGDDAGIGFTLYIHEINLDCFDRIRFDFGYFQDLIYTEVVYHMRTGTFTTEGIAAAIRVDCADNRYMLDVCIPWSALPLASAQTSVSMLLGMVRHRGVWDVVAGMLVPLILVRGA